MFIGYIGTDSDWSAYQWLAKKAGVEDEINNQRKAFLDMLAWSEELITDVRTRNHGYDVIVGGELFTDYPSPRKLVTLNPKPANQQAPDATSFSPAGGMPTASSLA